MKLKKHESPRKRGRNDKGKLASARLRQIQKRNKQMAKNLQIDSKAPSTHQRAC